MTDSTDQLSGAKSHLNAKDKSGNELYYTALSDETTALRLYSSIRGSIQTGGNKPTNPDSTPYTKYIVTNDELCYRVNRMNNTVICGKYLVASQSALDKLLDSIHYRFLNDFRESAYEKGSGSVPFTRFPESAFRTGLSRRWFCLCDTQFRHRRTA